jgi:hypothetical protein
MEEIYILKLHFSNFDNDNIMRAARTLSDKPVTFNEHKLEYPKNRVFHAEYDERTNEIQVVLISSEAEIRKILDENRQIHASASVLKNHLPRLFFSDLVLNTEPLKSGCKTSLTRVPDLETAIRLIFSR